MQDSFGSYTLSGCWCNTRACWALMVTCGIWVLHPQVHHPQKQSVCVLTSVVLKVRSWQCWRICASEWWTWEMSPSKLHKRLRVSPRTCCLWSQGIGTASMSGFRCLGWCSTCCPGRSKMGCFSVCSLSFLMLGSTNSRHWPRSELEKNSLLYNCCFMTPDSLNTWKLLCVWTFKYSVLYVHFQVWRHIITRCDQHGEHDSPPIVLRPV